MMRLSLLLLAATLSFAPALRAQTTDPGNAFGHAERSESGLIGTLYDFKQNQRREPTNVGPGDYPGIVHEFLEKNWDESVLNRYFRCARPLYTTQVFVPEMSAREAPKAFGVENVVKPSCWVVHYKGQVSPPQSGRYRFVGCSDDLIVVAVDGKTVLAHAMFPLKLWASKENYGARAANNRLAYGDWVELSKDSAIDLDIITGERPGGSFNAFLLYQKEGASYPLDEDANPILPIFQLGACEVPKYPLNEAPLFTISAETWHGY